MNRSRTINPQPARSRALTTALLLAMNAPALPLPVPERGFVSSQPAASWEEGLLCGNGTLGINALSRPLDERIIFSHERLWMPMGHPVVPPDQSLHLPKIRSLIAEGSYREACALQFEHSGQRGFMYPDFFVPAFDLVIGSEQQGVIRDYGRSVDFATGVATVRWSDDRGPFTRRMFVSRRHGVAVLLIEAPSTGALDCRLRLEPRESSKVYNSDSDIEQRSDHMFRKYFGELRSEAVAPFLAFHSRCLKAYPGSIQSVEGHARVIPSGGATRARSDGSLEVTGADRILVLVDVRLPKEVDRPQTESARKALTALPADFDALLAEHAPLHGELFNRVRLDLGGGADHAKTTEQLMAVSTRDTPNRALIEKQFDAGRYNIICATGELPPNLQGVWGGTYVPDWASDYTHNGNVPSAIGSLLSGNMPELMLAYTAYIESLIPDLELNARHLFGARGVVLPSRTSTHGYNNALNPDFAGGMWVAGAGWAAHFFYDYYQYTGDRRFLAEHALPFMEKALLFFEDYLVEGADGTYVFSPGTSPENTPGNSDSQASYNATMDVAVARELLRNTIAASRELDLNAGRIPVWEAMLTRLPDYQIDERGLIKEWLTPRLANNDAHRHSSQFFPLYGGLPAGIADRPAVRTAFRKSIEYKLDRHWRDNKRGYMSFGLVQLGLAAASLGEGELAYTCLRDLIQRFWLANLASTHNHRSLFNMDISGGMPAVIIRMLVASQPGSVHLLPALPRAWPEGSIEGLLCRGAIKIHSLRWRPGRVEVTLRSRHAQEITLRLPRPIAEVTGPGGGSASIPRGTAPGTLQLSLPAGQPVSLDIRLRAP